MVYIVWMVVLCGHQIKKKISETSIFELPRVKNYSGLCTNPLGDPTPSTQYPNKVKTT